MIYFFKSSIGTVLSPIKLKHLFKYSKIHVLSLIKPCIALVPNTYYTELYKTGSISKIRYSC